MKPQHKHHKLFRKSRVGHSLPWLGLSRFSVSYLLFAALLISAVFVVAPRTDQAQAATGINEQLNFQARLLNDSGALVPDGDYNIRFKIYQNGDGDLGGGDETLVWTEEHYDSNGVTAGNDNRVRVVNGYISVQLNSICGDFSAGGCASNGGVNWNDDTLWLSIDIGGTTQTATPTYDGEMDPFIRFTSVPYAFNANQLDGKDSSDFVQINQGEQSVNTGTTLIAIDQAGAGDLIDLQVSNSSVFNLANNGNLTVSGSGSFQGLNAGSGLMQGTGGLTISGTVTFSSLTNCDTIDTDGTGVLSCGTDDGGGGGSVDDLNDAYDNFGANPALITIDAAESQTGGLEFALNTTDNFTIDLQNTGDFVLQDNNVTFLTISDNGSFDYTLDATDNPTFTVLNSGSGNITYNLAGTGDFVIQDNGTPVFTVSDGGNVAVENDLTVGGNLDLGFTPGSVPFQGASGLTEDNAQLFWDDTNNKLGLGTATPHADAFGGLELVISDKVAGATAGISIQSGASLETQFILRSNDTSGYTELATLGTGNALLLYTNASTRAIFPSTGGFVVGGTLTDGAFGTIEARGSTSATLVVNPRTAGGTGDLIFYEADAAQTGFRYDGTTNTTYFRDFANSANRVTLTQAGDFYVSANGGTTGTPRTMAFNNLSSGEAVRFQFGDPFNAFQNQYGGSLDIYAYHSIRLIGDRNAASAPTFSSLSNIGVNVINTVAASEALVVTGAGSQSGSLFVVEDSTNADLFEINANGTFSFATSVYNCSGNANGGVLTVDGSGNVICDDDDGGVGSGGVDSVNSLTGAITIQGTTNEIVVGTSSPNITLSLPDTVTLGDTTNAGIIELNDSSANAYKTIIQSADLTTFAGNLTLTLPGDDGDSGQCIKTDGSGVLSFSNCNNGSGGGGAITLQDAYEAGNFITTDDGGTYGNIQFTLADTATDRNFTVSTATGAAGYTYLSRADGAGTVDPNQLLLVEDLEANRSIADGIKVQATFGMTDGLDVSDGELTNAINIGGNAIAGTNFSVTDAGAITSVGLNSGSGLIQGTGGLTINGTITFSSLTNCDTIDTDGAGVLSCGTDASGGGGLFTQGTGFAYLDTTTDELVVGASTSQSAKLAVVGDADEVQLKIFANGTQTSNVLEVNTSAGSGGNLLRLDGAGDLYAGGDISIDETNQLILDAGTGSNSYIRANDNGIEFISDAVEVFKARNNGRVGIGTFNPQARLEVDVANTANVPALILDMNDTTNNPDVLVIENAGTGNSIEVDGTDFIVDSTGNVLAAGNINANGGSLQTNSVARVDNSGNLVNIGNLTATGSITISSTGAGNDITLSSQDQIVLSSATDSQAIFQIQDAGGQAYLTVDSESATDALAVKIGAGSDDVVLVLDSFVTGPSNAPNGAMFYDSTAHAFKCRINGIWEDCDTTGGGGGIINRVNIFAEYAGGTLHADGLNNSGTMTADYDSTQRMNYYEWASTSGSLQDYDIVIHTAVPSDFSTANDTSWYIYAYANDYLTAADNEISVAVYEGATQCNTTDNIVADTDLGANSTWAEVNLGSMASCTLNANDKLRIEIKMSSRNSDVVRVGDIRWDYDN